MNSKRNINLDILKGIAIISVVLYHFGLMPLGYLGVDIFLVVNGYLVTKGLSRNVPNGVFNYIQFLYKKILRLWPLVLLASLVVLVISYFTKLPDDLENVGNSVVASNVFANNILARITSKNYWDVTVAYKPLMHTWYLGILMQCYIIYPLFFLLANKIGKSFNKSSKWILGITVLISFLLYILPFGDDSEKFYFLQYRFFEIGLGGMLALYLTGESDNKKGLWLITILALTYICAVNLPVEDKQYKLVLVTLLSVCAVQLCVAHDNNDYFKGNLIFKTLGTLGEMSFSIYIWHQVIYALYRYSVHAEMDIYDFIIVLVIVAIVSWLSFKFIETPTGKFTKCENRKLIIVSCFIFVVTTGCGLYLHKVGGVVRDVPELDITKENFQAGMHAQYNDRVYGIKEYKNNGKLKILASGNSFMRDWVNVILESNYKDSVDIVYCYGIKDCSLDIIKQTDIIFILSSVRANMLPQDFYENLKEGSKILAVGLKYFGESNGNVYARRFTDGYHQMKVTVSDDFLKSYKEDKAYWGGQYIDMMKPVLDENRQVPVFTPEGKFISQDCHHLTKAGAQLYSRLIDLDECFK